MIRFRPCRTVASKQPEYLPATLLGSMSVVLCTRKCEFHGGSADGWRMPLKTSLAMQWLTIPLTAFAIACSASVPSREKERAEAAAPTADSVRIAPAAIDLTGAWATGSTGEPAVRRIVLHPECNYSPAVWLLEQRGDTLRARAIPASRAQGVLSSQPVSTVAAEGRVSGVDLTLRMADASYVLRYDSTSGHLRGTLNGAPFWAVRQVVIRPQGCIPPP